jgi:UDP-N-acetylglucosamine--N-acetylmuramyl-(pentapeptide) pyrophosphoryl-undecaprenol N-acetylglucosamine transferase
MFQNAVHKKELFFMHDNAKNARSRKKGMSPVSRKTRILIAAGGTGGHIYPAIAIADAIIAINSEAVIKFVGTRDRMEWKAVPKAGYEIVSIWISGFHRRFTLKNILFPVKLLVSLIQSWMILSSFKPDLMISCGGFAAGPPGWLAGQRNIPLFIQEQNSFPGITNRLLAKNARLIFTAFKEADHYFPAGKTKLTGNPTRKTLVDVEKQDAYDQFNFSPQKGTLLVLGGSGGARRLNEAVAANMNKLHDELELQIIWQCGGRYYPDLHQRFDHERYSRLRLINFLDHMAEAYAAADVVVCRAGALTCAELSLTGNASILVPSPNVAGDHQMKNAQSLVRAGAALLLEDGNVRDSLHKLVEKLMSNVEKRKTMQQSALRTAKPNAANDIAGMILRTINSNNNPEFKA